MSVRHVDHGFAFTIVDDDEYRVTIEVSEEDYQREKAAGVEEESLLKPGQYKLKRGGFLARHPKMTPLEKGGLDAQEDAASAS